MDSKEIELEHGTSDIYLRLFRDQTLLTPSSMRKTHGPLILQPCVQTLNSISAGKSAKAG
jgi:hypothetical protein